MQNELKQEFLISLGELCYPYPEEYRIKVFFSSIPIPILKPIFQWMERGSLDSEFKEVEFDLGCMAGVMMALLDKEDDDSEEIYSRLVTAAITFSILEYIRRQGAIEYQIPEQFLEKEMFGLFMSVIDTENKDLKTFMKNKPPIYPHPRDSGFYRMDN